jgi:hypothetical protein
MPRGQEKQSGVLWGTLGSGVPASASTSTAEAGAAVAREVSAFAQAWFQGDTPAMSRCLHPEYVNRLLALQAGAEPRLHWDPEGLVRGVVGLQGQLGAKTAPDRRSLRVRVLDVRARSASAVAELAGWVLHVHLARGAGRWNIVNAMWEMPR